MALPVAEKRIGFGARIGSFLATPLGKPTSIAVSVAAAFTLWGFSLPGGPSASWFLILYFTWVLLGAIWLVRVLGMLFTGGPTRLRANWVGWVVPAAIVIATGALVYTSAPLLLRFNLSQTAMDSFAAEVIAEDTEGSDRVGLFSTERVERFRGGMRFIVPGSGFLDSYGFAYSPEGEPPRIGEDYYSHLEGPWYLWEESW